MPMRLEEGRGQRNKRVLAENCNPTDSSRRPRVAYFSQLLSVRQAREPDLTVSFDDLVGAANYAAWHGTAKFFRGPHIDHKLDSCRMLDRQVGRLCPLQDAIHKRCGTTVVGGDVDAVAHEPAVQDELPNLVDCRQAGFSYSLDDAVAM